MATRTAHIALGSNLGDRQATLDAAVEKMATIFPEIFAMASRAVVSAVPLSTQYPMNTTSYSATCGMSLAAIIGVPSGRPDNTASATFFVFPVLLE